LCRPQHFGPFGTRRANYQHSQWWAWPLPSRGPVQFICQWPTLGTGETRVRIDAQLILDAARGWQVHGTRLGGIHAG